MTELPTRGCNRANHITEGACWECCDQCNRDDHACRGCGEPLRHDGREWRTGQAHGDCT